VGLTVNVVVALAAIVGLDRGRAPGVYQPWIFVLLFAYVAFLFWRAGASVFSDYEALSEPKLSIRGTTREGGLGDALLLLVRNDHGEGLTVSGEMLIINDVPQSYVVGWGDELADSQFIPSHQARMIRFGSLAYRKTRKEPYTNTAFFGAGWITYTVNGETRSMHRNRMQLDSLPITAELRLSSHDAVSTSLDVSVEIAMTEDGPTVDVTDVKANLG